MIPKDEISVTMAKNNREHKTAVDLLNEAKTAVGDAKTADNYETELIRWNHAYKHYERTLSRRDKFDERIGERIESLATEAEARVHEMNEMSDEIEPLITEASEYFASGRDLEGSDNYEMALNKFESGAEILAEAKSIVEEYGNQTPASLRLNIKRAIEHIHKIKIFFFSRNLSYANQLLDSDREPDAVTSYESLITDVTELTEYRYGGMKFDLHREKLFDTILSQTADQIEWGIVLFERSKYGRAAVVFELTGELCKEVHKDSTDSGLGRIQNKADNQMDICARNLKQTQAVSEGEKNSEDVELWVPQGETDIANSH